MSRKNVENFEGKPVGSTFFELAFNGRFIEYLHLHVIDFRPRAYFPRNVERESMYVNLSGLSSWFLRCIIEGLI